MEASIKNTSSRLEAIRAALAAAAIALALALGTLCPTAAFAGTTAYVNEVQVTLHASASSSSSATYIKFGTKVTLGDYYEYYESSGTHSSWREVTYNSTTYYVYEESDDMFASSNPIKTSASSYSTYSSATSYQKAVMTEALSWLSASITYGHEDSSGVAVSGVYTFDCSGFAAYVLNTVMQDDGVYLYDLSTDIDTLYATTASVNYGYSSQASPSTVIAEGGTLDEDELQPGDIIFFDLLDDGDDVDHCGIYLGDGLFIQVTDTWDCACVMPLDGIYVDGFVAARRYLPTSKPSKINSTVWTTSQKTGVFKEDDGDASKKTTLAAEVAVTLIWADGDSSENGAEWGYVKYTNSSGSSSYGYILLKYLSSTDPDASYETRYTQKIAQKLYSSYSTSSSSVTVSTNTKVTYYGRYADSSYYKVDYNGKRYYVYVKSSASIDDYLLTTKVSKANTTMYTTSLKTAVYKTASSSGTKKTTLAAEVAVTLIYTDDGNWSYVSYTTSAGKTAYGYILSKYLSSTDPDASSSIKYVKVSSLKLYKSNSTSSSYKTVKKNTLLTYYGRYSTSSYYKVDYNGTRYYVYAKSSSKLSSYLGSATVKLSSTSYTYSGSAKKPTVTVKIGSTKLTKGTHYTVTYKNNTKIGTATVTIKGKGSYSGSVTKTFTIKPKQASITSVKSSASKQLTVKWSKVSGSVTGYQVAYRVKGSSTWKTTTTTSVSKTIKSLTSGKTYQVKVRAYKTVSGTKYYGSYSSVKTVTVK